MWLCIHCPRDLLEEFPDLTDDDLWQPLAGYTRRKNRMSLHKDVCSFKMHNLIAWKLEKPQTSYSTSNGMTLADVLKASA